MVQISFSKREINLKIVYYGMALCGKTTSLQFLHSVVAKDTTTKLFSVKTEEDRTLFFDFLPISIPAFNNFKIKLQIYTVPGQVRYNATRKAVLVGADGIVLVIDSQQNLLNDNVASFEDMKINMLSNSLSFSETPIILQYNKRDLSDTLPLGKLNSVFNKKGQFSYFPTVATTGKGIVDSFVEISKQVMRKTLEKHKLPIGSGTLDTFVDSLRSAFVDESFIQDEDDNNDLLDGDSKVNIILTQDTEDEDSLIEKAVSSNLQLVRMHDELEETKKSLEKRIDELLTANKLSGVVLSELEPDRVIELAAESFQKHGNFNVSVLLNVSRDGEMVETHNLGMNEDILHRITLENNVTADILIVKTKKPVFINSKKNPKIFGEALKIDAGLRSIIAMPLVAKNKILGLLNLYSNHRDHYDKNTLFYYHLIANNVAIALENAKLYKTVSHMNNILKNKNLDLNKINSRLEELVKERTEHLQIANTRLYETIEELKTLDKLKDDFMGLISHELRTPLTSIISYSQSIMEGIIDDAETQKDFVGIIYQEGKALEELIEKVLDTVNIENDRINIDTESYSASLMVINAKSKFKDKINEKKLDIAIKISDCFVIANPAKGEQVLSYVLDNAIKVSQENTIITIESYESDETYTLYIKDSGPGIPGDKKDFIFDRFKVLESLDKHHRGLGLSLHLARFIMKKMGGKIYLQNPGQKGAVFAIEFKKGS